MKYCVACGTKLRNEAHFCYRCGMPCDDEEPKPWEGGERKHPGEDAPDPGAAEVKETEEVASVREEPSGKTAPEAEAEESESGSRPVCEPEAEAGSDEKPEAENVPEGEEQAPSGTDGETESAGKTSEEPEEDADSAAEDRADTGQPGEAEAGSEAEEEDEAEEEELPSDRTLVLPKENSEFRKNYPENFEDFSDLEDDGEDDPEDEEGKKKHSLLRSIILVGVLSLLVSYIAFSPARRAYSAAVAGNSSQARELYEKSVRGNALEDRFLRILTGVGSKWVMSSYNKGKMTYDNAEAVLTTLADFSDTAEWKRNQLATLRESKDAYEAGCAALKERNYADALTAFKAVQPEDSMKRDAEEKATTASSYYHEKVMKDVEKMKADSDYPAALTLLEEAMVVLPEDRNLDNELKDLRISYATALKKESLPVAQSYISDGYYKEAIDLLKNALYYSKDDEEMKALLNTAISNYEAFVKEQVAVYVGNKDYEGAMALLSRGLEDIPDDVTFIELYKQVKKSKKAAK